MEALKKSTGHLLLLTLLLSPFLYGGTTDEVVIILNWLLFTAAGIWACHLFAARRWPAVPKMLLVVSGWILIHGWLMALNARSLLDREFWTFLPQAGGFSFLPGALDGFGAKVAMKRITALVLMVLIVADLARSARWVRRSVYTMASSGVMLATFGLWQKSSRNGFDIWPTATPPDNVFATFWYHANAAAFLNMTWPLAMVATTWAFRGRRGHWAKALWTAGTGIIITALSMNVSKAGHLIGMGLAVLGALLLLFRIRFLLADYGWRQVAAWASLILIALTVTIAATDSMTRAARWREWLARSEWDSRFTTAQICIGMVPAAGFFGYGPGSFVGVFHQKTAGIASYEHVVWKYAHDDFVQYLVEWGVLGGLAWWILWGLGAKAVVREFWQMIRPAFFGTKKRTRRSRERWGHSFEALRMHLLFGCSLSLTGVLIHAAMDFPLQIMSLQIYALTLLGILCAQPRHESDEE